MLAEELLEEAGVAVLPGTAFGHAGKGYIRLAYTQGEQDMRAGLERIDAHVRKRTHFGVVP